MKTKELTHRLNNSLTIISGNADYMKSMGFDKNSCNAILKGVKQIIEIIKEIKSEEDV